MNNYKTLLVLIVTYYINLFILKIAIIHLLGIIGLLLLPILYLKNIRKNSNNLKSEAILSLIVWSIIIIPTGITILMTIPFGFPPEGYTPLDIFRN